MEDARFHSREDRVLGRGAMVVLDLVVPRHDGVGDGVARLAREEPAEAVGGEGFDLRDRVHLLELELLRRSWCGPRRALRGRAVVVTVVRRAEHLADGEASVAPPLVEERSQDPDARSPERERIGRARRREPDPEAADEGVEPVGEPDDRPHVPRRTSSDAPAGL